MSHARLPLCQEPRIHIDRTILDEEIRLEPDLNTNTNTNTKPILSPSHNPTAGR